MQKEGLSAQFPCAAVTLQKPGAAAKSQSPQVILHTCVQ